MDMCSINFPELFEIESSLNFSGDHRVRDSLLELLRSQVTEWKSFSGRAALDRYLMAA
jgi:hypothetical protein